jgi:deazaflavin-dependent oxidoreductase (nitroreductase family)
MAGTHALDRWLYRGGRANWLARRINGATARVAAAGRGPTQLYMLEVRGRRSGRIIRLPVVVADYEGERYLVSMLGDDTNWVRNVRAAGGRATLTRGRREPVQLDEVDGGERGAILRRYLACSPGARSHIEVSLTAPLEDFAELAAQYPIFRVRAFAEVPA